MKRIAIFIDGTWNRPDAAHPTNVLRLSQAVKHRCDDNIPQVTIYAAGVGSGRGNTRLGRWLDRTLGGALGWGLLEIIEDVYRQLIFLYDRGDEIYIFGFSRGAFAARSLAGLIRSAGILHRDHIAKVPEAMALYVARGDATKPDDAASQAFRETYAPDTATSTEDLERRLAKGSSRAIGLTIEFIGVWDTVKALGVPGFLRLSDRLNAQYAFHDDALSSSVMSARHAVAIDETRATFPSLIWGNLDRLNRRRPQAYLQRYFPGDHGSVGGGGPRIGLSSITLHWIAMGAEAAGLALHWPAVDHVAPLHDSGAALTNKPGAGGLSNLLLGAFRKHRAGPVEETELSLAALDRYVSDPTYRPRTLAALHDELFRTAGGGHAHLRGLIIDQDGGPTHIPGQKMRPRFEKKRRR